MDAEEKLIYDEAKTAILNEYDEKIGAVEKEIHDLRVDNAKQLITIEITNKGFEAHNTINAEFYTKLDDFNKKLRLLKSERIRLERMEF